MMCVEDREGLSALDEPQRASHLRKLRREGFRPGIRLRTGMRSDLSTAGETQHLAPFAPRNLAKTAQRRRREIPQPSPTGWDYDQRRIRPVDGWDSCHHPGHHSQVRLKRFLISNVTFIVGNLIPLENAAVLFLKGDFPVMLCLVSNVGVSRPSSGRKIRSIVTPARWAGLKNLAPLAPKKPAKPRSSEGAEAQLS